MTNYHVVDVVQYEGNQQDATAAQCQAWLNQMAQQGWSLVTIFRVSSILNRYVFVSKGA